MNGVILAYTIAMTALIMALFVVMRQRDRAREEVKRAAGLCLFLHRSLLRANYTISGYRAPWHN